MARLDEKQLAALRSWYKQDWILDKVRALQKAEQWEELEDFIHKGALMPLGRHDALPAYMLDEKGQTLFADNLSPIGNEEGWQDGIDVGWEVVEGELGLSHDAVHIKIRDLQQDDWDDFLRRAEERKKK